MQLTQKHLISISVVAVLVILGYFVFQNFTPSPSDDMTNTGANTISQSGIETDTAKRLETIANSGTNWGMTPFGSGKPLEEQKKPEFKKPNTEWKTRTINGITYVFGEGNPVSLTQEEKDIYKKCVLNTVVYAMECPLAPTGAMMIGHLTSNTEKDLISLLSSPLWERVLTNCEQQFRIIETSVLDFEANYDRIMSGEYLSMENLFSIDDRDGRKTLSNNFGSTMFWLSRAIREDRAVMGPDVLKLNNCITQNGGLELYRLMDTLYQKQFYPDGNYPDRLTDPSKYIPAY